VRVATSLVVTIGLVASLAACTTSAPDATDPNCEPVASGAVSEAVKVTGEFGAKPTITFTAPTEVEETQRTVVIAGDGDTAVAGDTVNVNFSLLNGTTGDEITATEFGSEPTTSFPLDAEQFLVGIVDTITCSTVGSRVVGVIPAADAFGADGSADLGVEPDQALVFVVDVVSIDPPVVPPLSRADGEDQPATEGFPTVVLDADGRPTVTIPDTAPPTELKIAVLKQGDGAEVQDGDDVVVHYVGMNWASKVIFDESWARGEPAQFNTAQVIPGFTAALVGQKVGSQVIVIVPPDQGYGEGTGDTNGTIVFVIDILGIA
jgi:peptidylprolyl isomerase